MNFTPIATRITAERMRGTNRPVHLVYGLNPCHGNAPRWTMTIDDARLLIIRLQTVIREVEPR